MDTYTKIKIVGKKRGYPTIKDLAEHVPCAAQTISRMADDPEGRRGGTLLRVAELLGTSVSMLTDPSVTASDILAEQSPLNLPRAPLPEVTADAFARLQREVVEHREQIRQLVQQVGELRRRKR